MNELEALVFNLSFVEKFIAVCDYGIIELWEDRREMPNLSLRELRLVVNRIEKVDRFRMRERKSFYGPHGLTGEDHCFYFECSIRFGGVFDLSIQRFFIKGYFFEKNDLCGVTIQSFRKVH